MANAFDEMNNAAGGDMFITGGAMFNSKYENDMTPQEQGEYEIELKSLFMRAYNSDQKVRQHPVSFNYWLKKQNPEDMEAMADKLDHLKDTGQPYEQPVPYEIISSNLQKLAHLHTGRIEDLFDIVANMEDWKNQDMNPETGFVQY